jgi:DNA-binding NarL/FixJ family response regulator
MQEVSRPRILIADDHTLVAEAIKKLLEVDFEVVAIVHDGRRLLDLAQQLTPDAIVLDIGMPLLNGLEAGQRIKHVLPAVRLIYVSVNQDPDLVAAAMRNGASAYLPKTSPGPELIEAIRNALGGGVYISPLLEDALPSAVPPSDTETPTEPSRPLTDRQMEVLQLLAEGKSMKEVGAVLNIATRTIAFHKYRLMKTLHLENDAEIVQYAMRRHVTF